MSVRYKWWSLQNRLKGYQFRVIQRHRCCSHTTPHHYQWCTGSMKRRDRRAAEKRSWGGRESSDDT